jgi:hypothetical protein
MKPKIISIILTLTMILLLSTAIKTQNKMLITATDKLQDVK